MISGLQPDSSLAKLTWMTNREQQALQAAGMQTIAQLLRRLPRRYEDRRKSIPIHLLQDGDSVCVRVHVYSAGWRFSYKRYFEASTGTEGDSHGARLYLRWFNMPYVARLLAAGMNLSVFGKVKMYGGKLTIINPDFEVMEDDNAGHRLVEAAMGGSLTMPSENGQGNDSIHTGRIVPIYRSIPGVSARAYRELVWRILKHLSPDLPAPGYDVAPAYPYWQAVHDIHFPAETEYQRKARLRFALAECFEQQLSRLFVTAWWWICLGIWMLASTCSFCC